MSSTYHVLCLSHDPATLIAEFGNPEDAQEAISKGFSEHPECDILISRVSGGPIEFGCPGDPKSWRNSHRKCFVHNNIKWVDKAWLRLLFYVQQNPSAEAKRLMSDTHLLCWSPERVNRLRFELGYE